MYILWLFEMYEVSLEFHYQLKVWHADQSSVRSIYM